MTTLYILFERAGQLVAVKSPKIYLPAGRMEVCSREKRCVRFGLMIERPVGKRRSGNNERPIGERLGKIG